MQAWTRRHCMHARGLPPCPVENAHVLPSITHAHTSRTQACEKVCAVAHRRGAGSDRASLQHPSRPNRPHFRFGIPLTKQCPQALRPPHRTTGAWRTNRYNAPLGGAPWPARPHRLLSGTRVPAACSAAAVCSVPDVSAGEPGRDGRAGCVPPPSFGVAGVFYCPCRPPPQELAESPFRAPGLDAWPQRLRWAHALERDLGLRIALAGTARRARPRNFMVARSSSS